MKSEIRNITISEKSNMEQNNPTTSDRQRRLGSSDARKVLSIALRGGIAESDNEFLALLKGEIDSKDFSSASMQLGVELEKQIFEILKTQYPDATTNDYIRSEKLSNKYGIEIGLHPDFIIASKCIAFENKAVKEEDSQKVIEEYLAQLSWEYMIMSDVYGKEFKLYLSHYCTKDYDDFFDAEKLKIVPIDDSNLKPTIKLLKKGLKIISEALPTFVYVPKEELSLESVSLSVEMQEYFTKLKDIRFIIENAKKEEEIFKEKINSLMEEKNVKKIELIDLGLTLTRVLPMTKTTFDSKAFQKDRPKVYEKYLKQSQQKGSVRLKWKDNDN